jgi:nitroreductase
MQAPGPSDPDLRRILSAGIRVPDHGRIEPWKIQVLRKVGQDRMAALYSEIYSAENPDASEVQIAAEQAKPLHAPIMLVVSSHPDAGRFKKIPLIEQQLSVGAVCQNILIGATALGYAAQWITGWPAYHPKVRQALGHSADTVIAGFIYLGSHPHSPPKERARPDYDSVVSSWDGD